ncbi:MAG: methionine aminotransferase [Pseudomonadota bacterium]
MKLTSKLPDTGITIFSRMTALANAHGAINLSQGFPDFEISVDLIENVHEHMRAGRNQYAPMQGVAVLREKIAQKVHRLHQAEYDPDSEITITSGATEAIFDAITAVVHPGDEVIVFEPAYDSYVPAIQLCAGVPVFVKLHHPDYHINWNEVAGAVNSKTRLIILNSPHNPTGAVLTEKDITALIGIVRNTDIFILSDEVYEHIIFDGRVHESMCRHPELFQRSFVVCSFGKMVHATGWKTGYCLAPKPLSQEFQKIHQFVTFAANTPVQYALADYISVPDSYSGLSAFYQDKRDFFRSRISGSQFKILPCRGSYFQLLDYSNLSDEPDEAFARRLTTEFGVAAIPPSVFYQNNEDHRVLRFCFAKTSQTLEAAAERLCSIRCA